MNTLNYIDMDKPKILSVIELQNKYYFIFVSSEKPSYKIMEDCEFYYDFAKINKPIKIIEQIKINDDFIIDLTVKTYMYFYGYNYVRGGSYSEEILSKSQENTIEKELDFIENVENIDRDYLMKQIQRYNKNYISIEEIDKTILEIRENFQKYEFDKRKYDELFPHPFKDILKHIIPEDFDWLYDICILNIRSSDSTFSITSHDKIYIQKYKILLNIINYLNFLSINTEFFIKYSRELEEYSIYLKYPQFIFDDFIYHNTTKSSNKLEPFCLFLKTLLYVAINRIDEYKYDMLTYEYNIEWTTPRILYILEKKKTDFNLSNLEVD